MNIFINTHSSIKAVTEDGVVWFDPFRIDKPETPADVICFTHSHYDHFSPVDALKVFGKNTIIVAPYTMKEVIKLKIPVSDEKLFLIRPEDQIRVHKLVIQSVKAYNIKTEFHPKSNKWVGYILYAEGKSVYVCGDTDLTEEAKQVKCDVLLVPIGGTYTMDYSEGAKLANIIRPKVAVPTHYGSIVGEKSLGEEFVKLVDKDVATKLLIK